MPIHETDGRQTTGLGAAVKQVAERVSAIVRLELELAAMELQRKVKALGLGLVFGLGAAVFLFFTIGFAFATIAAALATAMATWAALLIVTGALFLMVAVCGVLAIGRFKKGTPPLPEQAIREAKLTTDALKSNGR
jgi:uncharacterized membrane protein YqjE